MGHPMRIGVVALLGVLTSVSGASAQKVATLSVTPEKVYPVLLEVIATEYQIGDVNKDAFTISFRSGMSMRTWKGQDGSCIVIPVEDGAKSRIVCNTEKRGSQLFAWGEGGAIQKKVLKLLTKELAKREMIPATEVVK